MTSIYSKLNRTNDLFVDIMATYRPRKVKRNTAVQVLERRPDHPLTTTIAEY